MRTILLDTQIALWIVTGNPRLPQSVRLAASREDICWIFHQASLWEIQIKYLLGKLPLPSSPESFLPDAIKRAGFLEAPIENDAIYFLARVPTHHNDPFDRLLLAHAMFQGWEVATTDKQWHAYPVRIFNG